MHLKSLELVGFKSFADQTLLEFGDGISAIVGPNGCGKSNISDSIRWVLGEQSVRLLRGIKMEDCIFNGTDTLAPKNMAEVSLTLTDCEQILGTDYHEVTVTRRVFRSGEGQYFINRTPCRLKDIQRLFMDTGLGTNSYSVMEQGKIDLILRSRPEDRREVFEEASGITKYKADKREALRKLEQTENNLLRLADIIKEVKRQIISIQRQAGKAERYKKLYEQLRLFDVYAARERLQSMAAEMTLMEAQRASIQEKAEALQHDIERLEADNGRLQDQREKIEGETFSLQQTAGQMESQAEQLRQTIATNSQRLKEHLDLINHDTAEIDSATAELGNVRKAIAQGNDKLAKARVKLREAEQNLKVKGGENARHEEELEKAKQSVQQLLTESMELEDRLSKSQNELHQLENSDRIILSRRERCTAEHANLHLLLERQQQRVAAAEKALREMTQEAAEAEKKLCALGEENQKNDEKAKASQSEVSEIQGKIIALSAQLDLLGAEPEPSEKAAPSSDHIDEDLASLGIDRARLLGRLSEQVEVEPEYRVAFEAVLRDLLDAVVVADVSSALQLLRAMEKRSMEKENNIFLSLVVADMHPVSDSAANRPAKSVLLVEKVSCAAQLRPLFMRLLQNVWVVESLENLKPPLDPRIVCVTRRGAIVRGLGTLQIGAAMSAEQNPILKRKRLEGLKAHLSSDKEKLACAQAAFQKLAAMQKEKQEAIAKAQSDLGERRQTLARQQGQHTVIQSEADQIRDNLETVSWELKEIEKQGNSTERKSELIANMDEIRARRIVVKRSLEELNNTLKTLEQTHKHLQAEVMAANVAAVQHKEEVEHLNQMGAGQNERIAQLESLVNGRNKRISAYQSSIEALKSSSEEADRRLPLLKKDMAGNAENITAVRKNRDKLLAECKSAEENIKRLRNGLEGQRNQQGELNGKIIELRMRREHLLERITGEYHISAEVVGNAAEPSWSDGKPAPEQLDSLIAELRAKIEAMGPVNTGAIEEWQQLQERHEFLTKQQDDLVKARQQLLDAIRKINQTTTEMFAKTFAQINENFQTTFSQLFGGGTAKLILTDEGDILECGIEIYARPPGKKLQSISLLSGGESTMTAVALLFAIFMVKPSPFCVLDELDATLDDANNQRFINMLKSFLQKSQFVVITHNRQTIAAAGVLYGVTMEKDKISRMVSMRFNDSGKAELAVNQPEESAVQAKN